MLLHHPVELLGMLLAGLLVPLKQAAEVETVLQRRVAVVGSSVLLVRPLNITRIHSVQWEHLNGTAFHTILQYERHNLTVHVPYIARVHLHTSNGSLLLEDLQESDRGIYRVTVNREERESLMISLDVLKPVSHPQLWSSGLVAKASGEVLCEVAEGRADTFTWKKDGQMLPPDRSYRLSGSISVLYLRMAKKSDCGSYSCNASNGISWQETSLNITVAGLSPSLQDVLRISVVAVVFAAVSGWGIIFPVCQSEKLRIRGELWRWLSAYTCGLVCISSILTGTAGLLWMREEGPSIAVILPEIFLLYVIVITFLVASTVAFQPTKLTQLKSTAAQRTLGYAAPGGVLLVVLTSSMHMKNIHQRHEEGCTAFVDVTTLVVSTAAVLALPLLAIFLCYHTTQGWLQERDSGCAHKESNTRGTRGTCRLKFRYESSASGHALVYITQRDWLWMLHPLRTESFFQEKLQEEVGTPFLESPTRSTSQQEELKLSEGLTAPQVLAMSITYYLLLPLLGSSHGVEITERKLAAEGSSVMMHAPAISNVNITEWEYIEGITPKFILQYFATSQHPVIYSGYEGRVVFYQTNGSLLLQQLRKADSGVYKATVDLMEDKARTTILEVIEPVPQPKLLSSSDLDGFLIKLTCLLPNGTTAALSWKKDGRPLPPQNRHQFLHDPTMLWIRKGEKSDCGSYSCNVSNAVSWKEATFNLTVAGLLPPFRAAVKITVAALVLAVIAAISFVIWLLQPGKHRLGKEVWAWLPSSITGLLGISCLLLFVTSVIWMHEEGPSAVFILHGLCFLAAAMTAVLMAVISRYKPEALACCPAQICDRANLYSKAITLAVSLSFSSFLLHNFQQLHKSGCSEPVDVTVSCTLAVLAAILLLLFSFWYHKKTTDAMHCTQATSIRVKEDRDQNRDKKRKLSLRHAGDDVQQEPC